MNERWIMNRMGFVNFWLYDVEEFVFENGKLLLRGQNGSGKSITTQSFIPFILDGDRTPSRLDPFGSSDRRMEYYFLGEEGKEESTGYLYLEFRKGDTDAYRTIGIGQRARKGKPMDFWGFVVLDGRRIGDDLWLYREVGSTRIPLEKAELKKALGEEALFTDVPREYKEMVNRYLFGFGRADQYEQFIRLLVKVRAPKLSKEFKPSRVYDILNDSLQTLTDEDLRPMVDAMEKMDGIQGNLDQLNRALADVKAIRNEYMRYNRYLLGKKGQAYLEARKAALQARAQMDRQELNRADLQKEQREKQEEAQALRDRDRLAAAELESLLDTDLEETGERLDKARQDRKEEQERKERIEERIRKSREAILERDGKLHKLQGQKDSCLADVESEKEELKAIQETLQWNRHGQVLEMIEECDISGAGGVMGELQRYQREVIRGKEAIEKYGRDQKQLDGLLEEAESCKRQAEEKKAALARAGQNTEQVREACIRQLYQVNGDNREWKLSEEDLRAAEKLLQDYTKAADGRKIDQFFAKRYRQYKNELDAALWRKEKEITEQKVCLEELEKRRDKVQNRAELEPERREAAIASRKRLEEAGIRAVPFYKTVEFAPGLGAEACARLEEQLKCMGLLDALVMTERDLERVRKEFPEFLDCVVYPQKKGGLSFSGLTVNQTLDDEMQEIVSNILSSFSWAEGVWDEDAREENRNNGSVWVSETGEFGHGLLFGRAEPKAEAEYIGTLARAQKKERLLRRISEEIGQAEDALQALMQEKGQLESRIGQLEKEYDKTPATEPIDQALEEEGKASLACQQADSNYCEAEKRLAVCRQNGNRSYQEMLSACRPFPYGRTVEEYSEAVEGLSDYMHSWQTIYGLLMRLENIETELRVQQELTDRDQENMEDAAIDKRDAAGKIAQLQLKITQYEEYLNRPEIREKAQRRESLKKEQYGIRGRLASIGNRLAVIEDNLKRLQEDQDRVQKELLEKTAEENLCRKYFQEELDLKLVLGEEERSLEESAKEALKRIREGDGDRDVSTLTTALHQAYSGHNSNLANYGTAMEECFEEAQAGSGLLRKRLRIVSVWNGKKLYLEEFYQTLRAALEETGLLIRQKDRELFEDILSKTISQQLTERIAESRKWVRDMSALMKLDTSMGLYFSLDWKPKAAENDQELDIKELEKILLRDYALLDNEDIEKVALHFRSKIRTEKQRAEEAGESINYMDLVRDALDYRKWFEFQMFYYRNKEGKKNLTNSAFNKFSGGEKAMAMYVPLFAAVNAQYQKAGNKDHPRIIALDEAFAGVDDKNISSMFKLVEDMDFDYIMNSQALWGCFETVPALRISELHRPQNSQVITVIHYTWNGQERVLDEQ